MKKLSTLIMVVIMITFSTEAFSQITYGLKGGTNLNMIKVDIEDFDSPSSNMKVGFNIGGTIIYSLNEKFSLQSGIILQNRGGEFEIDLNEEYDEGYDEEYYTDLHKTNAKESPNKETLTFSTYYIEVPLNVIYKINKFELSAGPYMAFGVGGKLKIDNTDEDLTLKPKSSGYSEESMGDDEFAFRMFDYGFNFGLGYNFGVILVNAEYNLGLGNVMVSSKEDEELENYFSIKNRGFSINLIYMFGK